jgi:hypothetical protein
MTPKASPKGRAKRAKIRAMQKLTQAIMALAVVNWLPSEF